MFYYHVLTAFFIYALLQGGEWLLGQRVNSFQAVSEVQTSPNDGKTEKQSCAVENNDRTRLWPRYQSPLAIAWRQKHFAGVLLRCHNIGNRGASKLVTMRRRLFNSHGFREEDILRFKAEISTPILYNISAALFWLSRKTSGRHDLSKGMRCEAVETIEGKEDDNGKPVYRFDISHLEKCPLLLGTCHEVLRQFTDGTSARRAIEDIMLNKRFLVKDNTLMLVPFRE
ncbi:hypothetical protein HRR90_004758 [Exophiala dermatitidis]|uniref:Uncharacterized protein n=2 Tax=Exophiala dermatitidis TaxID=5970 RepID=H6C342_EXODN|nr:uncharacterized protein HMPREF1120_06075 [Exophiala dermatitidis NIH/UT8656]KAJ4517004.1 hypothetical protein HRR74_004753 [Exophiala dermatitidis]EHY58057.1 hypothetical protein HMPREF1120_06075 [Exophiala dermatitidis NIH/UT8656]KAJ4534375.1 hypothetical protein HRR76_006303 [Exophiala dermatitidis]KAJ4564053.1 hypothetical protein HRR79_006081 [Exophiala dermatitidis]KAJ4573297.1 hypothetical protein HRR81_004783 [Exophiala dermatitidis]